MITFKHINFLLSGVIIEICFGKWQMALCNLKTILLDQNIKFSFIKILPPLHFSKQEALNCVHYICEKPHISEYNPESFVQL